MNKIRLNHLIIPLFLTAIVLGFIFPTESVAQTTGGTVDESLDGPRMTQLIELRGGWNAIYLEIEPENPSDRINLGTEEEPIWVHEMSTIEAIFGTRSEVEEVWGWHVPTSSADYIIDPSEADAWNNPGWRRYVTESGAVNADANRDVPTNLVSLHANRGYLVKLADSRSLSFHITGKPTTTRPRLMPDTYNLAGFPLQPDANPSVKDFFENSPITQVYQLTSAGEWEEIAESDTLAHGTAYFLFYDQNSAAGAEEYAGPLTVIGVPSDGLHFLPGSGGQNRSVRLENHTDNEITVTASQLPGEGATPVALKLSDSGGTEPIGAAELTIPAQDIITVELQVPSREQNDDGATILELSSDDLGMRWLIPVTARSGSMAGLWIGDVTVNDVSESRLGGTNVADGELTVALRGLNGSGLSGAASLREQVSGADASVDFDLQIRHPAAEEPPSSAPPDGEGTFVAGYLFEDANQNGQRDGDEAGLPGLTVTLGGGTLSDGTLDDDTEPIARTQSGADGAYLFENLAAAEYTIEVETPANYTSTFEITLPNRPVTQTANTNRLPERITIGDNRIDAVEPAAYLAQVMPADFVALPYEDGSNQPMDPHINIGFVPIYNAALWTTSAGGCGSLGSEKAALGQVVNGQLKVNQTDTSLNPQSGANITQLLGTGDHYAIVLTDANDTNVACGEIKVGSPTRLTDGRGSEFTFRILLRVAESGRTELLPYYETKAPTTNDVTRISSANFSMTDAVQASGAYGSEPLGLAIMVEPNDPRNPFKHKYHPDHDNLNRQFLPIDTNEVNPNLWESYKISRQIRLETVENLLDIPAFGDLDAEAARKLAIEVDWGGATWGGLYHEVMSGVHKNDITVQGHFVVRHILTADQLEEQPYD